MNKVNLIGRLVADPEVRNTESKTAIARFTLAVQRKYKSKDGKVDADFINCTAIGKNAEFAEKYLKKGLRYCLCGHIQTGNYTNKEGQKVYTTEVVVDEYEFIESKSSCGSSEQTASSPVSVIDNGPVSNDGFMNIPDGLPNELPFD